MRSRGWALVQQDRCLHKTRGWEVPCVACLSAFPRKPVHLRDPQLEPGSCISQPWCSCTWPPVNPQLAEPFYGLSLLLWFVVTSTTNFVFHGFIRAPLVAQMVKNSPAMQETCVWFLGWEDPLEEGMATHSSIFAWTIPWTEEPGGLQSMGSQRVRHSWATQHTHTHTPGKSKCMEYAFCKFSLLPDSVDYPAVSESPLGEAQNWTLL